MVLWRFCFVETMEICHAKCSSLKFKLQALSESGFVGVWNEKSKLIAERQISCMYILMGKLVKENGVISVNYLNKSFSLFKSFRKLLLFKWNMIKKMRTNLQTIIVEQKEAA